MPRAKSPEHRSLRDLQQIPNVGPATAADLRQLGVKSPNDLIGRDPLALYDQLCAELNQRVDPCVLDVFMAAVRYVEGAPKRAWWYYTAERKQILAARNAQADNSTSAPALGRRAAIKQGMLLLAGGAAFSSAAQLGQAAQSAEPVLRFGLVTDMHYADKDAAGSRHYRQTIDKLSAAKRQFAAAQVRFVVELGDFIDAADTVDTEKEYLRTIDKHFAQLPGRHHYVLGNHCVFNLTKREFLGIVGQPRSYYSFDMAGVHFVVLDACFTSDMKPYGRRNFQWTDANIPGSQLQWLAADLKSAKDPAVVFIHQRLDTTGHYAVKNRVAVRRVLETAGNVRAVFQGHFHQNDYRELGGIHYVTVAAMVEGSGPKQNAAAIVDVLPSGAMRVSGFHRQRSYTLET